MSADAIVNRTRRVRARCCKAGIASPGVDLGQLRDPLPQRQRVVARAVRSSPFDARYPSAARVEFLN